MSQKKTISLIPQVGILFAISVLVIGLITFFTQYAHSDANVKQQTETLAAEVAEEVRLAVTEYPAHEWLLRYWYEHADELDIEYDADYGAGTVTEEKCRLLSEHYPGLQPKYADTAEIGAMQPEYQKLYAEIAYSWLITRVNQIKRTYQIDYLFCVVTDDSFDSQFFLFSAADADSVRGTNYEEVYPLGTTVTVSESQQEAMLEARRSYAHLADAGDYVDYYAYLTGIDDHTALIGLTYNLSGLRSDIKTQSLQDTSLAIALQLCLSLVCLLLVLLYVLRPLKKVQHGIRLYRDTKDREAIAETLADIRSRNEIGELAHDITDLTMELDDYMGRIETITAERERIVTELSLAKRIQEDMLPNIFPPFPDRTEFNIYASMDPAREVGGDFYDFFLVDDDHLCLVIADVSGKGIPAALFMMVSKIVLANHAMLGMHPAQILTEANTAICDHNREEMFVTVWLGILEISTGRLTAANAGHEYPVLKQPEGGFEILRDRHCFVIGGMDGIKYKEYELTLEPGTKLFLYTDGVPEATNAENELFGPDRMLAALNARPDASPEELLGEVRQAVDDFVKEADQFDDLTMLCLEYKGPASGGNA